MNRYCTVLYPKDFANSRGNISDNGLKEEASPNETLWLAPSLNSRIKGELNQDNNKIGF